jgi:predicted Zn-dependent protease
VPAQVLDWIDEIAAEWFPMPTQRLAMIPVPAEAYDKMRAQYQSAEIMKAVSRNAPDGATRVLAITEADLAIPTLTFLFVRRSWTGWLHWYRWRGFGRSFTAWSRMKDCCGSGW